MKHEIRNIAVICAYFIFYSVTVYEPELKLTGKKLKSICNGSSLFSSMKHTSNVTVSEIYTGFRSNKIYQVNQSVRVSFYRFAKEQFKSYNNSKIVDLKQNTLLF